MLPSRAAASSMQYDLCAFRAEQSGQGRSSSTAALPPPEHLQATPDPDGCRNIVFADYLDGIITEPDLYRQRAHEHREEASKTTLPNVGARALHAAERWDVIADQSERSTAAAAKRDDEKAVRDADRAAEK